MMKLRSYASSFGLLAALVLGCQEPARRPVRRQEPRRTPPPAAAPRPRLSPTAAEAPEAKKDQAWTSLMRGKTLEETGWRVPPVNPGFQFENGVFKKGTTAKTARMLKDTSFTEGEIAFTYDFKSGSVWSIQIIESPDQGDNYCDIGFDRRVQGKHVCRIAVKGADVKVYVDGAESLGAFLEKGLSRPIPERSILRFNVPKQVELTISDMKYRARRKAAPFRRALIEARPPRKERPKAPAFKAQEYQYECIGIGGGGTFEHPASSPHNPDLMFVSCDMGGFYRSVDGGGSWVMVNGRECGKNGAYPVFHPTNPNIIITYDGREFGHRALRISKDAGITWKQLTTQQFRGAILYWDRGNASFLLCSSGKRGARKAYRSTDMGKTWQDCGVRGSTFYIDQRSPEDRRVCFTAAGSGVLRSDDGGATWTTKSKGLPGGEVAGFCGATDAEAGRLALFCIVKGKRGRAYRSLDGGESWEALTVNAARPLKRDFFSILMAETNADVVYVHTRDNSRDGRIFRSDDCGENWTECFFRRGPNANIEQGWLGYDSRWEYGCEHLHVNGADPDVVMNVDSGQVIISKDGGRTWQQAYTRRAPGQGRPGKAQRWSGIGAEVSGAHRVRFDPFERNRIYIGYMDFGFTRSSDFGKTWTKGRPGCPWGHTYDVVCDPDRKGVLYGAMGRPHDIPYWAYVKSYESSTPKYRGGVCLSTNFAESWTPILGKEDDGTIGPCTSIALDLKSPPESRTMYVTSYGRGLYKTTDGGKTWRKKSNGLISPTNKHVFQVRIAPDETLYCLVTVSRNGGMNDRSAWDDGGLFRSTDKAETWEKVNKTQPLHWPIDFAIHPENPKIIYVARRQSPVSPGSGIYKTTDGGETWERVWAGAHIDGCFSVALHPDNPEIVYNCTWGKGLLRSRDGGKTWEDVRDVPFMTITRVFFDPRNRKTMYVGTTGSSVWRGPAF